MSRFSVCPNCYRKGWYLSRGYDPNPEEGPLYMCRYCNHYERVAKHCTHPPARLFSWIVEAVPVLDDRGHWVPNENGQPKTEDVLCIVCCDCNAVLKGAVAAIRESDEAGTMKDDGEELVTEYKDPRWPEEKEPEAKEDDSE